MTRLLVLLVLALGLGGPLTPASAAEPARDASPAKRAPGLSEGEVQHWVQQLEEARTRRQAARVRMAAATRAWGAWRQRRYPRGSAKEELLSELQAAETELDAAEGALPPLYEKARRAGVPPGALRPFEERS